MCVSPNTLADGTQVACHICWQCRENRINDWVGRCIAESKTVVGTNAITLTYGRDLSEESTTYGEAEHPRAAVLTYSDVQKYFKLLRRHGYPLRYFAIGEYGSKKGRSHWHIVIFWLERVPPHKIKKRFLEPHWPHGWSFWENAEFEHLRYNMKYIQKDIGVAERQGHVAMSKKPPLGADYFADQARKIAQARLPLRTAKYTFPEAKRPTGGLVEFMLHGKSLELYIEAYLDAWRLMGDFPPWSELVDRYADPHSWSETEERRRER